MTVAFGALVVLLALVPAFAVAENALVCGIASVIAAVGMIGASLALPSRDVRQFFQTVKPIVATGLLVPCLWMLMQILPLGGYLSANPVWSSASNALGHPLTGTVTIDTGETVLALNRYVVAISIILLGMIVAMDRQRADALLVLSTLVTTGMAAGFIIAQLDRDLIAIFDSPANRADVAVIVLIGIVLSSATLVRSYEKASSQSIASSRRLVPWLVLIASLASFIVCATATLIAPQAIQSAAVVGTVTVVSVFAIRRWRLGLWGQTGLAATAVVILIALVATAPGKDADITLGLAGQRSGSIERMLSDVRWNGSGAGTFDALSPIYRDIDHADVRDNLTAAAVIAIEMGRPFLWFCFIAMIAGAAVLLRRAVQRRQDCFYVSAGAGCLLAFLVSSFGVYGTLGTTSSLLLSLVCGLAIAQSLNTTNRRRAKYSGQP
jgi:hypothetical protein